LFLKSKLSEPHNWLIHHLLLKSLIRFSPNIKGKILDIGCGKKPYEEYFSPQSQSYIGLEYAKTLHGLKSVDVLGDSLLLPFKDSSFDSAVSFQVMEHVQEPKKFLSEVFRILKPDGHFLLTTPFIWGEHEQPYDFYRYTRFGLQYLAEKTGFEIIEIKPDTKFWSTTVLRFNYYLLRFARGRYKSFLKLLMLPVFTMDQVFAFWLDKIPHNYTIDTATFSTLLKKPK